MRTFAFSTILIFILVQAISSNGANDATIYNTVLNGNHTEILHWTLENKDDEHILNCTLADDVEPDIFEWTYGDGSELNLTDLIYINETKRSLALMFINITYDIVDTYQCKSVFWDSVLNITHANVTNVVIFVSEKRKLELIIGMSAAAVVFFLVMLILIKKL